MWEYQTIDVPKDKQMLLDLLTLKQTDGWELVTLYERIQPVVAIGGTILVGVFRKYKPMMTVEIAEAEATRLWDKPVVTAIIQEPQQ